jgi:hypothetical protein
MDDETDATTAGSPGFSGTTGGGVHYHFPVLVDLRGAETAALDVDAMVELALARLAANTDALG